MHDLAPEWRLNTYLDPEELDELMAAHLKRSSCGEQRRLDLEGEKRVYESEQFGQITAYRIDKRLLFPLDEVGRCIGWKNPAAMIANCTGREKWKVSTSRQPTSKNFIEKNALRTLLQKSRSPVKRELIQWLCT